jgi:hypothetical protein
MNKPIYLLWVYPDDYPNAGTLTEHAAWLKKLINLLKIKFPQAQVTILYASRDPLVERMEPISHVKAFRFIHYPWGQAHTLDINTLVKQEWIPIFKKLGIIQ